MNGGFFTKHKPTESLLLYKFQGALIKVKEGRNVSQHTTLITQLALDIEDQEHPFMERVSNMIDVASFNMAMYIAWMSCTRINSRVWKFLCVAHASTSNLHLWKLMGDVGAASLFYKIYFIAAKGLLLIFWYQILEETFKCLV